MAGSSTFPTSVDNKTALVDGLDYMEADNVNNAYVPINKTQTFIGANGKGASWSSDILDYLANTKGPQCTKASASTISVAAGVAFIKNAGQSNRLMRKITSPITLTASDLDTGAMAASTYYYIYAVADTAATTFTCKFSASSTAPTGLTNFELIGWFYNESAGSLDITSGFVGNNKANNRDVPNVIRITSSSDFSGSSTTLADVTSFTGRFVSTGRPLLLNFQYGDVSYTGWASGDFYLYTVFNVDGVSYGQTQKMIVPTGGAAAFLGGNCQSVVIPALASGTHTIKMQYKVTGATPTVTIKGTNSPIEMSVSEL